VPDPLFYLNVRTLPLLPMHGNKNGNRCQANNSLNNSVENRSRLDLAELIPSIDPYENPPETSDSTLAHCPSPNELMYASIEIDKLKGRVERV
jgi:hypothetical protein